MLAPFSSRRQPEPSTSPSAGRIVRPGSAPRRGAFFFFAAFIVASTVRTTDCEAASVSIAEPESDFSAVSLYLTPSLTVPYLGTAPLCLAVTPQRALVDVTTQTFPSNAAQGFQSSVIALSPGGSCTAPSGVVGQSKIVKSLASDACSAHFAVVAIVSVDGKRLSGRTQGTIQMPTEKYAVYTGNTGTSGCQTEGAGCFWKDYKIIFSGFPIQSTTAGSFYFDADGNKVQAVEKIVPSSTPFSSSLPACQSTITTKNDDIQYDPAVGAYVIVDHLETSAANSSCADQLTQTISIGGCPIAQGITWQQIFNGTQRVITARTDLQGPDGPLRSP